MATENVGSTFSMEQHPDIRALRDRYEQVNEKLGFQLLEGLIMLGGLYAAISPWVIGFRLDTPMIATTDLIVGIALAALAFGFGTAYERTHGLAWVVPLMGAWLIVAPWVIHNSDYTTGAWVSNVVVGICVAVFGIAMFGMALARRKS